MPPRAEKKMPPKLEEVYNLLHTNADMICKIKGETIFFNSSFNEEAQAIAAEHELRELGLSPERKGTALLLTAQFPEEEIKDSRRYTTLIE